MTRTTMLRLSAMPLLAAALLLGGCSKPGNGNTTQGPAIAAVESGPVIAEFGSAAPSSWVNGAPMTFASARGSVVLVEAWGRF